MSDSVFDGSCVKAVLHGEIDLVRDKVDMVALVAPMRTVERVCRVVPLVGKLVNEALVTVPVSIKGDLADPEVVQLAPGAASAELLGVMKKVFNLPFVLFHPLLQNETSHNADR